MKDSYRAYLLITLLNLFTYSLFSQIVVITGNAFLENQVIHDSINIVFNRTAPSSYSDSTQTSANGQFSITIPTGIYSVRYKKKNYFEGFVPGKPLYANTTLLDTTLEFMGLNGNLKGIINPGVYKVGSNITVQSSDTLVILPGTTLQFNDSVRFTINGLLLAVGSSTDSILFKKYNSDNWAGIKFYHANSNSIMKYCLIEGSYLSGIRIDNCNPYFSNMTIARNRYDICPAGTDGGGGISFLSSNSILDSSLIQDNVACFGAAVFSILGHPILKNTNFKHNNGILGAAITLYGYSTLSIFNSTISATYTTGPSFAKPIGVYCSSNSNLDLTNCLIVNNKFGAVGANIDANMKIMNSTISNNGGTGISFGYGNCKINICNSIISFNTNGIMKSQPGSSIVNVLNSNIFGNSGYNFYNCDPWLGVNVTVNVNADSCDAFNNLRKNPLFTDTANRNYNLLNMSPCIDAGLNDSVTYFNDILGNIRIFDGDQNSSYIVDMGAYEYGSFINGIGKISEYNYSKQTVYPNPANDFIFLTSKSSKSLDGYYFDLINTTGQKVFQTVLNIQDNKINLAGIGSKGLFFYTLINTDNVIVDSGKIVIQ